MNAITLPKNPPSATMGIKTSSSPIRSSRPRSLARSDPLALAVLRQPPLGDGHALGELRAPAPRALGPLVGGGRARGLRGSAPRPTGRRQRAPPPAAGPA